MKDITTSLAFVLVFGLLITALSIRNDKNIREKGGNTEYIWEKKHLLKPLSQGLYFTLYL